MIDLFRGLSREKSTDVFFAGSIANRPNRARGRENLLRLQRDGFRMDVSESRLSKAEFLERCARALTVWSPEGFGYDCYRTYEAAAMGAVPILQYPTIQRYAPFLEGVTAIYYGVESDLLYQTLKKQLEDRARLVQMGADARRHVEANHVSAALARHIVQTAHCGPA